MLSPNPSGACNAELATRRLCSCGLALFPFVGTVSQLLCPGVASAAIAQGAAAVANDRAFSPTNRLSPLLHLAKRRLMTSFTSCQSLAHPPLTPRRRTGDLLLLIIKKNTIPGGQPRTDVWIITLVRVVLNLEVDKNASNQKREEMCVGSWVNWKKDSFSFRQGFCCLRSSIVLLKLLNNYLF